MITDFYTYELLYDIIARTIPDDHIHIELGVLQGASTSSMIDLIKKYGKTNKVYGVDIFDNYHLINRLKKDHDPFDITKSMGVVLDFIKEKNNDDLVVLISDTTDGAVKQFKDKKVFSVFIDADHNYESVKKDLNNYYKLVVKGGFLTGHDINIEPVKKALIEFIVENDIKDYEYLHKINCFLIRK